VEGIKTTIPFHRLALSTEKFRKGDLSTRFVEELFKEHPPAPTP
jgi:acetyl-CoA carboxylase biotin carboxylase subunit